MDGSPQVNVEAYLKRVRTSQEDTARSVVAAVNEAPDGAWIAESEMKVREIIARQRQREFELALQMRLEAAEAAFSPGGRSHR